MVSVQEKGTLSISRTVINKSKNFFLSKMAKKVLGRGQNGGLVGIQQTNIFLRLAQLSLKIVSFTWTGSKKKKFPPTDPV